MAHFAEVDETGRVLKVLVVPDHEEHRGQEFLANDLGLGGTWIQTSYNGNARGNYAGVGYEYHSDVDLFMPPRPHPEATIEVATATWVCPEPEPTIEEQVVEDLIVDLLETP